MILVWLQQAYHAQGPLTCDIFSRANIARTAMVLERTSFRSLYRLRGGFDLRVDVTASSLPGSSSFMTLALGLFLLPSPVDQISADIGDGQVDE